MGLGTNQMTRTTGAVFMPDVWSKDLQIERESLKVMEKLIKRADKDVMDGGNLLEMPFVSNLSATAASNNTAVTLQSPTETKVQISINRWFESSFAVDYALAKQRSKAYNLVEQYKQKSIEAITRKIQTDLTGLYSGLSQTTGSGHTAITEANIVRADQYLNEAKAPFQNRSFVVSPDGMANLVQIGRLTEYQNTGKGDAVMIGGNNGLVSSAYAARVYMTTDVAEVSGTPGTAHNLYFHRDFAVLALQQDVEMEMDNRPDFLAEVYVCHALWGFAELRDDHGVDVRSVLNV